MKESKADIQEDAVQKLMSEKGAYKSALEEKVCLCTCPRGLSYSSRMWMKTQLIVGTGDHETGGKA